MQCWISQVQKKVSEPTIIPLKTNVLTEEFKTEQFELKSPSESLLSEPQERRRAGEECAVGARPLCEWRGGGSVSCHGQKICPSFENPHPLSRVMNERPSLAAGARLHANDGRENPLAEGLSDDSLSDTDDALLFLHRTFLSSSLS
ncbi:hypothetical protein AVEN_142250-1 [Araneus ventricosus]|uniref:Uncharacterized protein n=1 Tax=Araneus ventricosus TaxID=182803 RepID=A0A4Y2FH11_ARAVE|nr:hypothetical protein AVEN_142250-1 [Araneus ventricosus]